MRSSAETNDYPMWHLWLFALGCGSDALTDPTRERDVLVEAPPGTMVIYRDGEDPWELAPRVGERFGFDVGAARYSVAAVDLVRRRVDSLLTTVQEDADVKFAGKPIDVPQHEITGLVRGLGESGGVVVSPIETVPIRSDEPFVLRAPEGLSSIVFARIDSSNPALVDALVVRRDVRVIGDLEVVIDFEADALPVSSVQVELSSTVNRACSTQSTFNFGSTPVLTSSVKPIARFPHQWLAGDHLTFTLTCDAVDSFSQLVHVAAGANAVPTRLERPFDIGGATVLRENDTFVLAWQPYFAPTSFYELVLNDECSEPCARWTTRFNEAWLGNGPSSIQLISPPDLEALGLFDVALDIPAEAKYVLEAVVEADQQRMVAGRPGRVETQP